MESTYGNIWNGNNITLLILQNEKDDSLWNSHWWNVHRHCCQRRRSWQTSLIWMVKGVRDKRFKFWLSFNHKSVFASSRKPHTFGISPLSPARWRDCCSYAGGTGRKRRVVDFQCTSLCTYARKRLFVPLKSRLTHASLREGRVKQKVTPRERLVVEMLLCSEVSW